MKIQLLQDNDDDSEAEKLSPLLNNKIVKIPIKKVLTNALNMDDMDRQMDELDSNEINLVLKKVMFQLQEGKV